MIILPRQARDKHRDSTPKRERCIFLQAIRGGHRRAGRRPPLRRPAAAVRAWDDPRLAARALRRAQGGHHTDPTQGSRQPTAHRCAQFLKHALVFASFSHMKFESTSHRLPRQARDEHAVNPPPHNGFVLFVRRLSPPRLPCRCARGGREAACNSHRLRLRWRPHRPDRPPIRSVVHKRGCSHHDTLLPGLYQRVDLRHAPRVR